MAVDFFEYLMRGKAEISHRKKPIEFILTDIINGARVECITTTPGPLMWRQEWVINGLIEKAWPNVRF
jgi:hypothetical protein